MNRKRLMFGLGLVASLALGTARADDARFDLGSRAYRDECGACHVAYPPQLLPAASWREVMRTLDRHFGTDASLEPPQAAAIVDGLVAQARRRPEAASRGGPVLRITETAWFRHEHDEVPPRLWKAPAVKSPANCAACHRRAEAGDYDERSLRLPK